ncbi:glycosyltransferase [uncultured Rhodospira sp.]|uniref:glycosyltransferase n=1 Tax=uncultured Rhodospira sp. TaxID=1936189 RepID=UPI002617F167|nr:glycosyltransferase [uncultured Rhodospira sp.]
MHPSNETRDAGATTQAGGARILHISADFPDPLQPGKTKAIANLIDLTSDVFDHHVYSINRVDHRLDLAALPFGPDWRAVAYPGPPRGLFLKTYLDRLAAWIVRDVRERGLSVDVVHAHKLSTDGLAGAAVAKALGRPLVISSQGISDVKILTVRRDLRRVWRDIWRGAAMVFPFAPWTKTALDHMLGSREGPVTILPCPNDRDGIISPRRTAPVFKTCFHLSQYRRKNVAGLIQAVATAARDVPDIRLDILGGGDPAGFAAVRGLIARRAPDHCRLIGPVPRERIQDEMNAACGFAMVPFRESFGMVYTEALLSGAPVIHAAGNGIAGYFEGSEAVVAVDPDDTNALAAALVDGVRRQDEIKATLRDMQESGALTRLTRAAIRDAYCSAMQSVLGAHDPVAGGG